MKKQEYEVVLNVFFTTTRFVKASSKEEAIKKAKEVTSYGEGEELSVFEVTKLGKEE